MNIYQKLLEIQKRVIGLGKDSASNTYRFVSGSKVLEHIKPLMNEYGLILKQEIVELDNTRQDYLVSLNYDKATGLYSGGKPKSEILSKVKLKFTWIDCETEQKDENYFFANGQNDWDKGVGSALTYAERYFLLKFFHIATDEDDIDFKLQEDVGPVPLPDRIKIRLEACTDVAKLGEVYKALSKEEQARYKDITNTLKAKLSAK